MPGIPVFQRKVFQAYVIWEKKLTKHFLAHAIFTRTSDFLLSIQQKPHESVCDYTTRFNQVASEVSSLSEREFI